MNELVSLLPHLNSWTEQERDTVRVVEHAVFLRGLHRPGDIREIPLTLSRIQRLLRRTGARRSGRDYARHVLATAIRLGVITDTGRVLKPRRQPRGESQYWWRVFRVAAVDWAFSHLQPQGAYPSTSAGSPPSASLYRLLRRQGLVGKRRRPRKGSIQWVFQNSGPP
jgi:hypothetical protein